MTENQLREQPSQKNAIQFKFVKELILHQLDGFEADRLLKQLPVFPDHYVRLEQIKIAV